jgi:uncharacterized protein YdeI (YjbR/CyaY-like superfamily)
MYFVKYDKYTQILSTIPQVREFKTKEELKEWLEDVNIDRIKIYEVKEMDSDSKELEGFIYLTKNETNYTLFGSAQDLSFLTFEKAKTKFSKGIKVWVGKELKVEKKLILKTL